MGTVPLRTIGVAANTRLEFPSKAAFIHSKPAAPMNSPVFAKSVRNLVACVGLMASAVPLAAQAVIAAPPAVYSSQAVVDARSKDPAGKRLSNIASVIGAGGPLFQRGLFAVRPHLLYRLLYADGLLNPGQIESGNSIIQIFSIGSGFQLGRTWSLDYTLTTSHSSNRFVGDSTDHSLSLGGGWSLGDLKISLSQNYLTNSPILVETAEQTRQKSYATSVSASYRLGARTGLSLSGAHSTRLANAPASSPEWTTSDWRSVSATASFSYLYSSRLQAQLGYSTGRDYVSRGFDMSYFQPNAGLTWRPTDKLSVGASVGFEQRKILDGTSKSLAGPPVYSANVHYQPTATTGFSISASRSTSASYFANQAIRSTGASFSYEQRLFQKFYWTTDISQGTAEYLATNAISTTGRSDTSSIIGTRVSMVLFGRVSTSVFFQSSFNSSSRKEFGRNSRQVGGELGYSF